MRQRITIECSKCRTTIGTKMGIPDRKGSAEQYLCPRCTRFERQKDLQGLPSKIKDKEPISKGFDTSNYKNKNMPLYSSDEEPKKGIGRLYKIK